MNERDLISGIEKDDRDKRVDLRSLSVDIHELSI
jgi:hypothetical protein